MTNGQRSVCNDNKLELAASVRNDNKLKCVRNDNKLKCVRNDNKLKCVRNDNELQQLGTKVKEPPWSRQSESMLAMQANECSVVSTNATQNDASKCIGRRDDLIKNADHRVSTKSRRRDDAKQTHGQCPEEHRVVVQMTSPKTSCKREVFHKKTHRSLQQFWISGVQRMPEKHQSW